LIADAADVAPGEVRDDVNDVVDAIDELENILDDIDYDLSRIDEESGLEFIEIGLGLDGPIERIRDYSERECGAPKPATEGAGALPDDSGDFDSGDADPSDDLFGSDNDSDQGSGDSDEDGSNGSFSGDSNSDWCVASREINDASDELDALEFTNPDSVRDAFEGLIDTIERARSDSPDEIRDAVDTSYDAFITMRDLLRDVDYDLFNVDVQEFESLGIAADNSSDVITAYNEEVCGIEPDTPIVEPADPGDDSSDPGDPGSEFDPTSGTIRDQVIQQLVDQGFTGEEAACFFEGIYGAGLESGASTENPLKIYEDCGIGLDRLADLGGG
jgi:hypothetical protein